MLKCSFAAVLLQSSATFPSVFTVEDLCEVLQGYTQTAIGLVHVTIFVPEAIALDEDFVLTSGSDARVQVPVESHRE